MTTRIPYAMLTGGLQADRTGVLDITQQLLAQATAVAAQGGGDVIVPAGTYRMNFSTSVLFDLPAKVRIRGEGEATQINVFGNGVAGSKSAFRFGAGSSLEDLAITFAVDNGLAFLVNANDIAFRRLVLNGGHTGTNLTTFHGWALNSNSDLEGLTIEGCRITNFRFGLLRSNSTTGALRRVRIVGNKWADNYANHVALNSPVAVLDDIDVAGNTFGDCPGGDAFGTFAIQLGMASATNYRIRGNHFSGICKESIHLEEAGGNIVIDGNTFDGLDKGANAAGGRAIYVLDNNIGGTDEGSRRVSITGNVLKGGATTADSDVGIWLIRNSITPATLYHIGGNVVEGFAVGIQAVQDHDVTISDNVVSGCDTGVLLSNTDATLRIGARVTGNVMADCAVGLACNRGWPSITDNVYRNCTTAITVDQPGTFGSARFIDCAAAITSAGAPASFHAWTVERTGLTVAATPATTDVAVLEFPDACNGTLVATFGATPNDNLAAARTWALDITSAGTITATAALARSVGAVSFSNTVLNASSSLTLRLANSGTQVLNGYVQASFTGLYLAS